MKTRQPLKEREEQTKNKILDGKITRNIANLRFEFHG
jgi:hypothetical protein